MTRITGTKKIELRVTNGSGWYNRRVIKEIPMTKPEEIAALVALNSKLRKQRNGLRCVSATCTSVVLTKRIILNERRIIKLSRELSAS